MNSLYSNDILVKLQEDKKKATKIVVCLMVGATLLNVGLLFLTNEYNKTLMQFITSIIYIIVGWISIYFIYTGIVASKRRYLAIKSILEGDNRELDGVVSKIGKPITLSNSIRCFEITVKNGRIEHKLYFEELLNIMPFNEGDNVKVIASNNFIKEYEVEAHEE